MPVTRDAALLGLFGLQTRGPTGKDAAETTPARSDLMISRRSAYFLLLRQILSDFHSPRQGNSVAGQRPSRRRFSLQGGVRQAPLRFAAPEAGGLELLCYRSNTVCGPIQGEVKTRDRHSARWAAGRPVFNGLHAGHPRLARIEEQFALTRWWLKLADQIE